MSCNSCSSQSCQSRTSTSPIKWRLDIRKVFRLLALISLGFAWYWGQQAHIPNWEQEILKLHPQAELKSIDQSTSLFTMINKGNRYFVSVATDNSYGGPITTATTISDIGLVKSVDILDHNDTPAYIQKLRNAGYFRRLQNKPLDSLQNWDKQLDAVSGATLSSNAIMRANTQASYQVATSQFGLTPQLKDKEITYTVNHALLAMLILLSIINIWLSNKKLKLAYVIGSTVIIGFMANQLISVGNFSGLLMGFTPTLSENLEFWILLGSVFIAIGVLGRNIYCGNICPFHGVQYVLHKLSSINLPMHPLILKYGRYIPKVGLWAALMIGFLTTNPSAGSYEPFSMIFSLQGEGIQWFILPSILIGAFFIPDMFCRFFCPVGEMLTTITNLRNNVVYQLKLFIKRDKGAEL